MKNRQKQDVLPITGEKSVSNEVTEFHMKILEDERFPALIACLFLSSGISLALFAMTVFDFSFSGILGYAFLGIVVIALFIFRWWIPLSGLGFVVLTTAIFRLYQGTFFEWLGYWSGFFNWVSGGANFHETYSVGFSAGFLQFLIIFMIQTALYRIVKRSFLFPCLVVLSVGVIIFSYVMQPGDMTLTISVCCIGLIILFPGVYARIIKKSGETDKKTIARMQLVAIPAAILAVLLAFWITPEDTRSWQSRTLVTLVDDINYLLRGPFNRWPAVTPNFSMYELGYQAERNRLGGPAVLTDDTVLHVTGPVNVLLKGRVFDVYTGSNWEIGKPDGDFRFDSILWRRYRREALGQDRPLGGSRTERLYSELTRDIEMTIMHANSRYQSLFTTGRIRSLTFSQQLVNPVAFFNMRSEIYMHQRMPMRHGIQLRTRIWDNSRRDFDRLFLELEDIALNENDTRFEAMVERYTVLPESLPVSVRELAAEITADDETPYAKVMSIVKWLGDNCEYSLQPDIVPEGEDFTEYFLETRIGYCTYFATALAVMARSEGIPARYITGFALEKVEYTQSFIATGETAHAWVEIYFNGIGWVEIDPLNWNAEEPLNSSEPVELPVIELPPVDYSPELPPVNNEDEITVSSIIDETPDENYYWLFLTIPLMLIVLYFSIRLTIRALLGRKNRQFALKKVISRKSSRFHCLETYYDDILKQLTLLYLQPAPGETLVTFPQRVDSRISLEGMDFSTIAKSLADYHFAGIEPDRKQVEDACLYHQLLEDYLLEWLGKWMYIFKRAIR